MRTAKRSRGFTLLETLIVVAIAGVAMAGVTAMIELISSGTAGQKFIFESHDMTEEIRTDLGDPAACAFTFQGLDPSTIPAANPGRLSFAGPVKDKTGNVSVYEVGKSYFGALKIRDMYLTNYLPAPPDSGTFSLFMDFDALAKVQGSNMVLSQTNISFTTDGSGKLKSCVAMSRATDGLWKITTGTSTNIYFADGNVGIGVPSAVYPLQVAQNSGTGQIDAANFSATGPFATVGINNVSTTTSQRSALVFEKNKNGIFEVGTDFSAAGAQNFYLQDNVAKQVRMLFDANGNLGLGTNAPASRIHIVAAKASVQLQNTQGPPSSATFYNDGSTHLETTNSVVINSLNKQILTLNAGGGMVGIGTNKVVTPLTVNCGATCVSAQIPDLTSGTWMSFMTGNAVPKFSINYEMVKGVYRAALFRNRSSASAGADKWWQAFIVGGQGYGNDDSVHYFGGTAQTGNEELVLDAGSLNVMNGVVWAGGTCVSGPCLSDARLKDHVRAFTPGLQALLNINPVYYRFNGLGGSKKSDRDFLGVIAQDVEKAAPEIVSKKTVALRLGDAIGTEIKRVEYGALIYVVINGIKELYREFTGIKDEVNALKKQNDELKRYICRKDSTAEFCP